MNANQSDKISVAQKQGTVNGKWWANSALIALLAVLVGAFVLWSVKSLESKRGSIQRSAKERVPVVRWVRLVGILHEPDHTVHMIDLRSPSEFPRRDRAIDLTEGPRLAFARADVDGDRLDEGSLRGPHGESLFAAEEGADLNNLSLRLPDVPDGEIPFHQRPLLENAGTAVEVKTGHNQSRAVGQKERPRYQFVRFGCRLTALLSRRRQCGGESHIFPQFNQGSLSDAQTAVDNSGLSHHHANLTRANDYKPGCKDDHPRLWIQIGLALLILGFGIAVMIGAIELGLRGRSTFWRSLSVLLICGDLAFFFSGSFLCLWRGLCVLAR